MSNKKEWIWNPKIKGSGIITCIPQTGTCPVKCNDCFFQSGRSYLEPLNENLPHIPPPKLAKNRIVRMNDGNDSNHCREFVEYTAKKYKNYFFNTSMPIRLAEFSGPVVLTINPNDLTDTGFHKVDYSDNLMFVRICTNPWNIDNVVKPAIEYYTSINVKTVLTFMAYYNTNVVKGYEDYYIWKKRTLNSYWVLKQEAMDSIMKLFADNPLVYSCGYKGQYTCSYCGNCIREYYNAKERLR